MLENPLIKIVPDSIDNAAKNITDAPTKAMGETLTDIWSIVFGGIHQVAEKRKMKYAYELEQFKQELCSQINEIPLEKLIEPKLQVVAPALENAKYCMEEKELKQLFKNLIVASMNIDYENIIHPSFGEIIKQMSPIDAENLKVISRHRQLPICDYRVVFTSGGFVSLYTTVFLSNLNIQDLEIQANSLHSLCRLGLLNISTDKHINNDEEYTQFSQTPIYLELIAEIKTLNDTKKIEIHKGLVELTPFGNNFVKVCLDE